MLVLALCLVLLTIKNSKKQTRNDKQQAAENAKNVNQARNVIYRCHFVGNLREKTEGTQKKDYFPQPFNGALFACRRREATASSRRMKDAIYSYSTALQHRVRSYYY